MDKQKLATEISFALRNADMFIMETLGGMHMDDCEDVRKKRNIAFADRLIEKGFAKLIADYENEIYNPSVLPDKVFKNIENVLIVTKGSVNTIQLDKLGIPYVEYDGKSGEKPYWENVKK